MGDYADTAKNFFTNCYTEQDILDEYRVTSIDFTGTNVNDNKLTVICTYKVELPFPVFGKDSIELHQEAKMGLWN